MTRALLTTCDKNIFPRKKVAHHFIPAISDLRYKQGLPNFSRASSTSVDEINDSPLTSACSGACSTVPCATHFDVSGFACFLTVSANLTEPLGCVGRAD